jgi:hypothetical protein
MRWEYKRLSVKTTDIASDAFEAQLNALGQDGWELVATVPLEHHGYSHDVNLLFKRPAGD